MKDNYNRILNATMELMVERGFHGTSVQMIADKVNVSKSTIFHYFKSKEGILLALFEDFVPSATNKLLRIVKNDRLSGMEKLKRIIQLHLYQVAKNGDVLRLYLREARFISKNNKAICKDSQRTYANLIIDVIRQVKRENPLAFANLDPAAVTYSILGMCNSAVIWFNRKGRLGVEDLAEQMYQMVAEYSNGRKTDHSDQPGLS
jgi:AcrR family transcriptional regulator